MKNYKSFLESINDVVEFVPDKYIGDVSVDDPNLIVNNENLPKNHKFKIGDFVRHKDSGHSPELVLLSKVKYYYRKNDINYCYIVAHPNEYYSRAWKKEDDLWSEEDWEIVVNTKKYNI
jgi:hypothetical protein